MATRIVTSVDITATALFISHPFFQGLETGGPEKAKSDSGISPSRVALVESYQISNCHSVKCLLRVSWALHRQTTQLHGAQPVQKSTIATSKMANLKRGAVMAPVFALHIFNAAELARVRGVDKILGGM
jgi:hypothetical protein